MFLGLAVLSLAHIYEAEIGKGLGCSVNDVLLACVAGAIGGWLREQGEDTTGKEIRAMVPVNLRPLDEAWKLGNRFGLVPLVLPIGMENPVERVYEVRRRMNALKGSTQPLLAFAVLAVAGLAMLIYAISVGGTAAVDPSDLFLAGLVLDESSILKSGGGTIKWNLIHSAKGIEYKLSCTATPAPNDVMEYASQAGFLEKIRSEGQVLWTCRESERRTDQDCEQRPPHHHASR